MMKAATRHRLIYCLALIPLLLAGTARAVVLNVPAGLVNFNVDGQCSLYEAIESIRTTTALDGCPLPSGNNDVVNLAAGSTYTLTTDHDLDNIFLPTQPGLGYILEGNGAVLQRNPGAPDIPFITVRGPITVNNLVLTGGNAASAMVHLTDQLNLDRVDFDGNGRNLDLVSPANASVRNSVFRGGGRGITAIGTNFNIANSTLSGLSVALEIITANGNINNSTFADSTVGIEFNSGALTISNTILDNQGGINCQGLTPTSADYNIDSDGSCALGGLNDLGGVDPLLQPLADNGGPTFTHLPQIGSAAIDGSQNLTRPCEADDQRGIGRPLDGDGNGAADCDIGAVEAVITDVDLTVTKVADLPSQVPGGILNYTITVTNSGPAAALDATVLDTPPAGLNGFSWTCTPSSGSACTASGTGAINDLANVLNGGQVVYNVTATVAQGVTGTISNTATASHPGETAPTDNSSTVVTAVDIGYNLGISKTDSRSTVVSGTATVYAIEVRNFGSQNVPSATVVDNFPAAFSAVSWTCSASAGASCPAAGGGNINANISLQPGASATFSATATVSPSFTGPINNTATVAITAPLIDQVPANNSAADTTTASNAQADLAIAKTVSAAAANPGDLLTYTVTAGNNGPDAANAARVFDTFSASLINVNWSCSASGGAECTGTGTGNLDETVDLPSGSQAVFTITGTVAQGVTGAIDNQAELIPPALVADPDLTNNLAAVSTAINLAFDLSVSKDDGQTLTVPGSEAVYTITVTNNGGSDLNGVTVSDTVPAAITNPTWTCAAGPAAACTASGSGDINDSVSIPAGGSLVYTLRGIIDETFQGLLENTAGAAPPTGILDQMPDDNSATDSTEVRPLADLQVTKTTPTPTVISDGLVVFDITVTNNGPNASSEVFLNDQWSDGLALEAVDAGPFACQALQGNSQGCTTDGLPAGASASLRLSFLASAGPGTVLNNAVQVNSQVQDPDDANNQASASVTVAAPLALLPEDPQLPDAKAGEFYSVMFESLGGLEPVVLNISTVPDGLSLNPVEQRRIVRLTTVNGGAFGPLPPGSATTMRKVVMAGTPERAGIYQIPVQTTDSFDPPQSVERTYTLRVTADLLFEPDTLPDATVGQDYLADIQVINGVPPYAITVTGLPNGLSAVNGSIQGQPGSAGEFEIAVSATDAQGNTGMRSYSLTVGNGLAIFNLDLPDGILNLSYGVQLDAGGGATPLQWSGGTGLPPGLSLADTGFISGIPQAAGDFSFSATVTDADGGQASGQFELSVNPAGLLQREAVFPPGLVGTAYSAPTAIAGGAEPYGCEVIESSLPPGLVLNGCNAGISGIPETAGTYRFLLGVMDSGDPGNTLPVPARIQVTERTPIPVDQMPNPRFQAPLNIPVPEMGQGNPGTGFADESLQQLTIDAFGNRYLVGYSWNGANYDIRVLKYDARGNLIWNQRFDSGDHDYGYAITVSPIDQSLYVGGYSLQGNQILGTLLHYDLAGVLQQTVLNGDGAQVKAYYALLADSQGVFAIGEHYNGSNFDGLITRFDHSGQPLWETVRESGDTETAYAGVLTDCTASGCDLIVGGAEGRPGRRGWLAGIDGASGALQALAAYPEAIFAIQPIAEQDLVIGASSNANDWVVRRTDRSGNTQWTTTIAEGERLRGIAIDPGGFILAAGSAQGPGQTDGLLSVIDPDGNTLSLLPFDTGQREAFHGNAIGPEGLLTLIGEQQSAQGTRFLLLNLNTGKAY